jgi:hypothetical protein
VKKLDYLALAGVWVFILLLIWAILTPSEAHAVNPRTRAACTGSYLNHCSHTTPGTAQCRACFRFNWKKLDPECKAAIKVDPAYRRHFKKH